MMVRQYGRPPLRCCGACALLVDHTVACWGDNAGGELASDPMTFQASPVPIGGLTNVEDIESRTDVHVCARTSTGEVYCWGTNNVGQIGDGTISMKVTRPTRVLGLP